MDNTVNPEGTEVSAMVDALAATSPAERSANGGLRLVKSICATTATSPGWFRSRIACRAISDPRWSWHLEPSARPAHEASPCVSPET